MVVGNREGEMRGGDGLDYDTGREGWPVGCSSLTVARRGSLGVPGMRRGGSLSVLSADSRWA